MAGKKAVWEAEEPPPLKRRKVRKGTQSCWECKRRKIRCTFVVPTESTCDGCKSRRVKCISQEFHDDGEGKTTREDRLDRMEALVEQLSKKVAPDISSLQQSGMQETTGAKVKMVGSSRCICRS